MRAFFLSSFFVLLLTVGGTACKSGDEHEPAADDSSGEVAHSGVSDSVRKCRNGCNSRCHGVKNKSKCVAECRRACER